jgi:hypothetical protein
MDNVALELSYATAHGRCQRCRDVGARTGLIRRIAEPGRWHRVFMCGACTADAVSDSRYVVLSVLDREDAA